MTSKPFRVKILDVTRKALIFFHFISTPRHSSSSISYFTYEIVASHHSSIKYALGRCTLQVGKKEIKVKEE